ncbi:transcription termination factor Rho [Paratractidigestivibacter sp.]|uniref:transcription termination factor Rho n=1 Tax=Paratractidigestivibacter sp. TaxID=2847316 RepID=UPI002AC9A897|nr:transcription termination factor Rho [Paratractidigestivibacter sp.]
MPNDEEVKVATVATEPEATEPEAGPKKHTRKTSKKKTAEAIVSAAEAVDAAEAPAAEKPKRRPGRPRKAKADEAAAGEATVDAAEAPAAEKPKRRPGRPRKAKADEAAAGEATVDAAEAPAAEKPKRRPGRPRKAKADEGVVAESAAASAPATSLEANYEPVAEAPAAEKPKRRSGRPRKAKPDAGVEEKTATVADAMIHVTKEATQAGSESMPLPAVAIAEADAQAKVAAQDVSADQPKAASQSSADEPQPDEPQSDGKRDADAADGERGSRRGRRNRRNKFDPDRDGDQKQDNNQNGNGKRNKRNKRNFNAEPSLSREDIAAMKVADLRARAAELQISYVGLRKPELVEAVYAAAARAEGFRPVNGILEIGNDGSGWLRTGNYMAGDDDCFVHIAMIRNNGLRLGDRVEGTVGPNRNNAKYPPLIKVETVNGRSPEEAKARPRFRDLTPVFPNERLTMECGKDSITGRAIDLVSPIGKGQRGLIVSPPKAGKTTVLKKICQSIARNNPEVHLFCLLVDERPEEVTDMERSIKGEVVASTFDMPASNHTHVSELVIERAKRLVEMGEDVVVVLDSITRLARAYNLAIPASGRILSGGVDSAALYPPKKFLGAARNIENGGSLTIIASALVDTGSKMDEVIFEEFKGTGNMELKLDRDLADRRIFPAIDPVSSGTRNEDLLISPDYQPFVWGIRRVLANMNNVERAANALVKGLKGTNDNREFLIKSAKKAQQAEYIS